MKSILSIVCFCVTTSAFAVCDVHHFRWPCQLPAADKPVSRQLYTVYCNNLPVYVDKEVYLEVMRYQHANVNMDLMIGDQYVAGPCIPGGLANVYPAAFFRDGSLRQDATPSGLYK
jgi:hypothetical protein